MDFGASCINGVLGSSWSEAIHPSRTRVAYQQEGSAPRGGKLQVTVLALGKMLGAASGALEPRRMWHYSGMEPTSTLNFLFFQLRQPAPHTGKGNKNQIFYSVEALWTRDHPRIWLLQMPSDQLTYARTKRWENPQQKPCRLNRRFDGGIPSDAIPAMASGASEPVGSTTNISNDASQQTD